MSKLVILYGHPADPDAFEDYYLNTHLPYAGEHMPNVRGAENRKIVCAVDGTQSPYYRLSQLSYDNPAELRAGISSEEGRSVLADLANFATGGATVLVAED